MGRRLGEDPRVSSATAALATTSSGHAASTGRLDYSTGRDEALAHAHAIVAATGLPVSADFEDCFAHDLEGVARTVELAKQVGLAGCSIEDYSAERRKPLRPRSRPPRGSPRRRRPPTPAETKLLLTARAENYLRGNPDLEGHDRASAGVRARPAPTCSTRPGWTSPRSCAS